MTEINKNFHWDIDNDDNYSFYRNQVQLSEDEILLRELYTLRNTQEDFNYHMIERQVENKIQIVLNEIKKRWLNI